MDVESFKVLSWYKSAVVRLLDPEIKRGENFSLVIFGNS